MNIPKPVLDIAKKAASRHASNIEAAINDAERKIRALPEFDELATVLVRNCIQELIYDARHWDTNRIKKQAGVYGADAKVLVGQSGAIQDVYRSVYECSIAGTVLGKIRGADLPALIENESGLMDGHRFNRDVLLYLQNVIKLPADKTVEEVVPETKLRAQFARLRKRSIERVA